MCHPFHVCVLDRYLLPENPECITESRRELAIGLLGYETDQPDFRADGGIRRIVAMHADPVASAADVGAFVASLGSEPVAGALVSVAAANTMGLVWYPDGWTHVWEQVFPDEPAMQAARAAEADRLAAGPMDRWLELWYEIEPGPPPGPGDPPPPEGPVLLVDVVTVPEDRVDAYLDGFTRLYLAGARRRGLELVACWRTPAGTGEDVTVTTALDVGTWAAWEQARNAAVADPDVAEWIRRRASDVRDLARALTRRAEGPVAAQSADGRGGPADVKAVPGGSTAQSGAVPHVSEWISSEMGRRRTGPWPPTGRPSVIVPATNTSSGMARSARSSASTRKLNPVNAPP